MYLGVMYTSPPPPPPPPLELPHTMVEHAVAGGLGVHMWPHPLWGQGGLVHLQSGQCGLDQH